MLLLAAVGLAQAAFAFDVKSGAGLTVAVDGVPVVRGSFFQYYEPDWSRGYYSSLNQMQTITRPDSDTLRLEFMDSNGLARGSQTFRRHGDELEARYRFEWGGERPVNVEFASGMIWAAAFRFGSVQTPGGRADLAKTPTGTPQQRRLVPDSGDFVFESPLAKVSVTSDQPLILFDARNYNQDWARGKQLWWLGHLGLQARKDKPAELVIRYRIEAKPWAPAGSATLQLRAAQGVVREPSTVKHALIPAPKESSLDYRSPIELRPSSRNSKLFRALSRRFEVAPSSVSPTAVKTEPGSGEGYEIDICASRITLRGDLELATERLASLAYTENGKLLLPSGSLSDAPVNGWRGVHLFVGPKALEFHKKLWDRVLRPLGFNKVVLQCERTDWQALPGTATSMTMRRGDLKKLFDYYRSIGVEPIPLIQSFGHMEWFFANRKNLELAYNPAIPYTLDVRKPEAQEKIAEVWEEAIALLKPKTIHFGCDEVDMRGFSPGSEELVTQMWERHMPFLGRIAERHRVRMMVWGDNMLAPGEAVDATHGHSAAHAARRRAVLPKGTLIADWHYRADPNSSVFNRSLELWKSVGMVPIASTWYRPENVFGFFSAANEHGAGVLQTTWAGYESNEENMLRALPQFAAMVLAGEYAWSGKSTMPAELGYDPAAVFERMYFGQPAPVLVRTGSRFGEGPELAIANDRFNRLANAQLANRLDPQAARAPTVLRIPVGKSLKSLALALSTATTLDEGDRVGTVVVTTSKGKIELPLIYGRHVRSEEDTGTTPFGARSTGATSIYVPLEGQGAVQEVEVRGEPVAGLILEGLSGW